MALQALDHVFVVHDLVPDIDRRAVLLQRALDDLDGTHDARAKAARLRQIDFHGTSITQVAPHIHFAKLSEQAPGHADELQYPHHAGSRAAIHRPKRMEAQGFVSKNRRRGKVDCDS